MKNLKQIKLILEQLEKEVNEDIGYDSEEMRNMDLYHPNHLYERFEEEIKRICSKYAAQDFPMKQMMEGLLNVADAVEGFFN